MEINLPPNAPTLREGEIRCSVCLHGLAPQGIGRHRGSMKCFTAAKKFGYVPNPTLDPEAIQSAEMLREIERHEREAGRCLVL